MFPQIEVSTLHSTLQNCNDNLEVVLSFLLEEHKKDDFAPCISFAGNSIPDSVCDADPFSLMLSQQNGPQASPINYSAGRRPHRCNYCGQEWPALLNNSNCSSCYMPYDKRYRY